MGGSVKELGLFFIIISVAMVPFAASEFYAEKDEQPEEFSSIPGVRACAIKVIAFMRDVRLYMIICLCTRVGGCYPIISCVAYMCVRVGGCYPIISCAAYMCVHVGG